MEIYFSRRLGPINAPLLTFNATPITASESHKHLGLMLDSKLIFDHHLRMKISKANKGIGLISRLRKFLPRDSLVTIYKSFVRLYSVYGDIIYDFPGNASFAQKIESVSHNRMFSWNIERKLYCELGIESLSDRRFSRRLFFFYKIYNGLAPQYLSNYLLTRDVASPNLIDLDLSSIP